MTRKLKGQVLNGETHRDPWECGVYQMPLSPVCLAVWLSVCLSGARGDKVTPFHRPDSEHLIYSPHSSTLDYLRMHSEEISTRPKGTTLSRRGRAGLYLEPRTGGGASRG